MKTSYLNEMKQSSGIFDELPQNVKTEIVYHVYDKIIQDIPFFKDKERNFVADVIPLLIKSEFGKNERIYNIYDSPLES